METSSPLPIMGLSRGGKGIERPLDSLTFTADNFTGLTPSEWRQYVEGGVKPHKRRRRRRIAR